MTASTNSDMQKEMLRPLSATAQLTDIQPHVCTTQLLQLGSQQRKTQGADASAMVQMLVPWPILDPLL